ncbi:MAG TPA: VOC family protein [Thermoanaerobaculia bacterium]|nr:VOC family protein [Thermoanaerobaculia bacterium]
MAPRLFRVILPVGDIERAAAFYSEVLGMEGERVSPGRHYFDCEGTILACFDPRADGDAFDARPNPDHLYFAVADLESVHAAVVSGGGTLATAEGGPEGPMGRIAVRPWGERSFYASDPFGNPLCFVDRRTIFTTARS